MIPRLASVGRPEPATAAIIPHAGCASKYGETRTTPASHTLQQRKSKIRQPLHSINVKIVFQVKMNFVNVL